MIGTRNHPGRFWRQTNALIENFTTNPVTNVVYGALWGTICYFMIKYAPTVVEKVTHLENMMR